MGKNKSEARARVKTMRDEQAKKDRKREKALRFGIAGAILAAVVIIAVAVNAADDSGGGSLPSSVSDDDNGVTVGESDAPATINSWIDFLCPHCKEFEDTNAEVIDEMVEAGEAKVVYHPLSYTGGQYSERANNAFACAAAEDKANEFVKAAFADPQQWSDDSLLELGDEAGIGGDYASCVQDGTYNKWARSVMDVAQDADITGTPTIVIEGDALDEPQTVPNTEWTPDGLRAVVKEASSG